MKWKLILLLSSWCWSMAFAQSSFPPVSSDEDIYYTDDGNPNNGNSLQVLGANPTQVTYIKFSIPVITGQVEKIELQLKYQSDPLSQAEKTAIETSTSIYLSPAPGPNYDGAWTEDAPPSSPPVDYINAELVAGVGMGGMINPPTINTANRTVTWELDITETPTPTGNRTIIVRQSSGSFTSATFVSSNQSVGDPNGPRLLVTYDPDPMMSTITGKVELYGLDESIECSPNNLPLLNMKDVEVIVENLSTAASEMDDTDVDGIYGVDIASQGGVFSATPSFLNGDGEWIDWIEEDDGNGGLTRFNAVSTSDITVILNHINFVKDIELEDATPILCPFKRLAADVNGDGTINQLDTDIIQTAIANPSQVTEPAWRFIPQYYLENTTSQKDLKFVGDFWNNDVLDKNDQTPPFPAMYHYSNNNNTITENYSYTTLPTWMDVLNRLEEDLPCVEPNWDFYAIKMGDVNGKRAGSNNGRVVTLDNSEANNQAFIDQQEYRVKVKASTTDTLLKSFQLGLELSTDLLDFQLIEVESALEDYDVQNNFGLQQASNKFQIRTLLISDQLKDLVTPSSGEVTLFSFTIKAKQNFSGGIEFTNEVLPTLFGDQFGNTISGNLSLEITAL